MHRNFLIFSIILINLSSCCGSKDNNCSNFTPTGLDIRLENNYVDDSTFVVFYEDTSYYDTLKTFTIPPLGFILDSEYTPAPFFTIHTKHNTQIDTITFLHMVLFDQSIGCKKCPGQFDSPSPDSYFDGTWSGYLNATPFDEKIVLVIP